MKKNGYDGEYLSPEDIIALHDQIIDDSDLNDDKGFLDIDGSLFYGAVFSIYAGFGGYEAYPSVEEKAARLCYNLITGHTFLNANKRTALMSMLMTLEMNGKNSNFDQKELFEIINGIGSGNITYEELLNFIAPNLRKKSIE